MIVLIFTVVCTVITFTLNVKSGCKIPIYDFQTFSNSLDVVLKGAYRTNNSFIRSIKVKADPDDVNVLHIYEIEASEGLKTTLLGSLSFCKETRAGVEFWFKVEDEDPFRYKNLWQFFF